MENNKSLLKINAIDIFKNIINGLTLAKIKVEDTNEAKSIIIAMPNLQKTDLTIKLQCFAEKEIKKEYPFCNISIKTKESYFLVLTLIKSNMYELTKKEYNELFELVSEKIKELEFAYFQTFL